MLIEQYVAIIVPQPCETSPHLHRRNKDWCCKLISFSKINEKLMHKKLTIFRCILECTKYSRWYIIYNIYGYMYSNQLHINLTKSVYIHFRPNLNHSERQTCARTRID